MVRSNTDLANLQYVSPGGATRSKMARWERRFLVACELFPHKKTSMAVPWACAPWPSLIDAIKMFTLDDSPPLVQILLCSPFSAFRVLFSAECLRRLDVR